MNSSTSANTGVVEREPLTNDKYTVGWITALPHETVAAEATLDEWHGRKPLFQHPSDRNLYILGRIGDHNVAITSLPAGVIGTTSATTTAMHMLTSFPSIRIGLMVGIGAGVPKIRRNRKTNKDYDVRDIRLGDVIVSQPSATHGGVKQYDLGKAIAGGDFQPSGFLNSPPRTLLNAVAVLRQLHESGKTRMPAVIQGILENLTNAIPSYEYPEMEPDRLFEVTYEHPENEETCDDCDEAREITRLDRKTDHHRVHCGVIASGNQVIKDPALRDRLGNDCICFEMEAAGLMNDFPCLVIRGVCDYADSHKNDCWQRYAAVVAAACAKEILQNIPEVEVEKEEPAKEVMQAVMELSKDIKELSQELDDTKRKEFLELLSPGDYTLKYHDSINRRQPGTGEWFLESPEYQDWVNKDQQTIFCPGIPGAGKTIMASIVIENLTKRCWNDPDVGVAYFFCDFNDRENQTTGSFVASVLKQLLKNRSRFPDCLETLYERYKSSKTRPTLEEVMPTLGSVCDLYSTVYIVIDALDEFDVSGGQQTEFLNAIDGLRARRTVNLFASSRDIPNIGDRFKECTNLKIRAQNTDIEKYLGDYLPTLSGVIRDDVLLQQEAKDVIIRAVPGVFLLARLHANSLDGTTTPNGVRDRLKALSQSGLSYEEAYKSALNRIQSQRPDFADLARRALSWVSRAKRLLSIRELQLAMAMGEARTELDSGNLTPIKHIIASCAGLVVINKKERVRLVHYTAQEFFMRTKEPWLGSPDSEIMTTCLRLLLSNSFCLCITSSPCSHQLPSSFFNDNLKDSWQEAQSLPELSRYAAHNWSKHAEEGYTDNKGLILGFINKDYKIREVAYQMNLARVTPSSQGVKPELPQVSPLHLAVHWDFMELMKDLLNKGHDPRQGDTYDRSPLSWAAEKGLDAIVKTLLDVDSTIANARGQTGPSLIHNSPNRFNRLLLRIDPRAPQRVLKRREYVEQCGATPLWYAALNNHIAVVRLLLAESAVDPNLPDLAYHTTPLWCASAMGNMEVVMEFVKHDRVILESADEDHGLTALSIAIISKRDDVASLLLERGANINSISEDESTPLIHAINSGSTAIAKLLLRQPGVNINAVNQRGYTAFVMAGRCRNSDIAKQLLDKGLAAAHVFDRQIGFTPLNLGVRYLQAVGAGLFFSGQEAVTETALTLAAFHGDLASLRVLLISNAAPNETNDRGDTALALAASEGHVEVVELLLERGADPNVQNTYGKTALVHASLGGYGEIVEELLERGADLNIQDGYGKTALILASLGGHAKIVVELLERGADTNIQDHYGKTALIYASLAGYEEIVEELLDHGADKYLIDRTGHTARSYASEKRNETLVSILSRREFNDQDRRMLSHAFRIYAETLETIHGR
ncbi:ankyrin repeat [Fusarium albosuccineum]|uniref:Ankyrin repeat n=1 Tax=Fusarium albosuccineum TaxID=1237068 RepID=A0A8H4LF08_9HYPO|nr:ankyrin repeat [Fusarium albosuccineum]